MNKIVVEVSVGELLDKISILEIKKEKIKDPEKLRFINNEIHNNDYLMVKGSNSTGLNEIIKKLN